MLSTFADAFSGEEHNTYRWRNAGRKAAILVHGFPGTPAEMQPTAMCLHEAGWHISVPLLPGFGPEVESLHTYSAEDWKEAIQKEVKHLKNSHDEIILIGYSMGGALAIQVAAQKDITGLVLFAPFWQMDHTMWKIIPFLKPIFPRVKPFKVVKLDFSDPALRNGVRNWLPDADLDNLETQKQIEDLTIPLNLFDQIRITGKRAGLVADQIKVPTLIFQGLQDELVTPQQTRKLIVNFQGSVRYIEVDANHELLNPFAPHWTVVRHQMINFLSDISEA